MDPLLRAAEHGRAVFVTTALAREALPYYGPYAVSKAGLEAMVRIYAGEVARTSVRVNLLDPGVVLYLPLQSLPRERPTQQSQSGGNQ